MDISALTIVASIVIALTGIIPGTLALIKQGRKDDKDSELAEAKLQFDINSATNVALNAVINPLKEELSRCQTRITELEAALIDKTTQIGKLMQEGIDKDTSIRQLQYTLSGMQMRLDAFEDRKRTSDNATITSEVRRQEDVTISAERRAEDLRLDEEKRQKVALETENAIKEISDKALMKDKEKIEGETK